MQPSVLYKQPSFACWYGSKWLETKSLVAKFKVKPKINIKANLLSLQVTCLCQAWVESMSNQYN